jgi:hypothetical protein
MGMFDFLKKKPEEKKGEVVPKEEKAAETAPESGEVCSACNQPGADKTFGGLKWHKKCLRATRRMAKGMI